MGSGVARFIPLMEGHLCQHQCAYATLACKELAPTQHTSTHTSPVPHGVHVFAYVLGCSDVQFGMSRPSGCPGFHVPPIGPPNPPASGAAKTSRDPRPGCFPAWVTSIALWWWWWARDADAQGSKSFAPWRCPANSNSKRTPPLPLPPRALLPRGRRGACNTGFSHCRSCNNLLLACSLKRGSVAVANVAVAAGARNLLSHSLLMASWCFVLSQAAGRLCVCVCWCYWACRAFAAKPAISAGEQPATIAAVAAAFESSCPLAPAIFAAVVAALIMSWADAPAALAACVAPNAAFMMMSSFEPPAALAAWLEACAKACERTCQVQNALCCSVCCWADEPHLASQANGRNTLPGRVLSHS